MAGHTAHTGKASHLMPGKQYKTSDIGYRSSGIKISEAQLVKANAECYLPECITLCLCRLEYSANLLLHPSTSQANGFSPSKQKSPVSKCVTIR